MRLDNAGPRTWLLAATAVWAVLAFLLALFGMGRHVSPLDASDDMRQPLPAMPSAATGQLGPIEQYAEIGARPLFSNDRKPRPFTLRDDEGEAEDTGFDYVLTSVLLTPRLKMAIIQPADGSESVRVKLDEAPESHPAWRLVELAARSAVFEGPEGRRNMELRVFDGEGGRAPTATNPSPGSAPPAGLPDPPRDVASDGPPAEVAEADGGTPEGEAKPAMTPESQMEAIRQRIRARRAALREQAQNQQTPPRQPMPPDPPSSPSPNPPAESR